VKPSEKIMISKIEAQSVADSLLPCPFCGCRLTAKIGGAGDKAFNPSARCETEDCMGSKLPVLGLDVPSQVSAWNRRASV
jgi:hypothetical protein